MPVGPVSTPATSDFGNIDLLGGLDMPVQPAPSATSNTASLFSSTVVGSAKPSSGLDSAASSFDLFDPLPSSGVTVYSSQPSTIGAVPIIPIQPISTHNAPSASTAADTNNSVSMLC